MNNIPARLDDIEAKIRLLIQENKHLKQKNDHLNQQLESQEQVVKKMSIAYTAELNAVKQQLSEAVSNLKVAGTSEVKNTKQLKQKIDKYVKKIDEIVVFLDKV